MTPLEKGEGKDRRHHRGGEKREGVERTTPQGERRKSADRKQIRDAQWGTQHTTHTRRWAQIHAQQETTTDERKRKEKNTAWGVGERGGQRTTRTR